MSKCRHTQLARNLQGRGCRRTTVENSSEPSVRYRQSNTDLSQKPPFGMIFNPSRRRVKTTMREFLTGRARWVHLAVETTKQSQATGPLAQLSFDQSNLLTSRPQILLLPDELLMHICDFIHQGMKLCCS
jgi:hypothetical protein